MTYEEFEEIVNKVVGEFSRYVDNYDNTDAFYIEDGFIIQKHETGGASGGDCWGGSAEYYQNEISKQDFLPLEKILTIVKSEISFLKFKEIERLIVEDNYTDSEYYGNYTNYSIFKLDIGKLYNKVFA